MGFGFLLGIRAMPMPLLYLFDAYRGSTAYPIMDDIVPVGRDPANRIVLTDRSVSRFHFRLYRVGSDYLIRDVGSRFGTFINGKRLTSPAVLRPGSWIRVGNYRLLYWDDRELCPLAKVDQFGNGVVPRAAENDSPPDSSSKRERNCRIRIWWRFSRHWIGFGWKIRRK